MSFTPRPIAVLVELVSLRSSGEFVCVAEGSELHVFLQNGRIAWATDSTSAFAFSRHLLENTSLTKETFQEVLESCRRDRLPIGETLIAWQLVTLEQIQAALRDQIRGALATLDAATGGRTIFLERERAFASYDAQLTFSLDSFLDDAVVSALGSESIHRAFLARVAQLVTGAEWFELEAGATSTASHPQARETRLPRALFERSVLDGAELVTLRTPRATVLGTAVPHAGCSLWCGVDPEVAFGSVLTALASASAEAAAQLPALRGAHEARSGLRPNPLREVTSTARWSVVGAESDPRGDAFRAFLERAPEVVGAFLLEPGKEPVGLSRYGREPTWLLDIARRRAGLLDVTVDLATSAPAHLEELGYRLCSVATAEPDTWCFGADLGAGRGRLWMFCERPSAQGLGWAYLTSMSRQIEGLGGARLEEGWIKTG